VKKEAVTGAKTADNRTAGGASGKADIGGVLLFAHRRMMACGAQPFEPPPMAC
jgi:hypothetical protein